MQAVDDAEIGSADIVLSIVPPAEALPLAERLASMLGKARRKPLYVDCNAVNPETVLRIADAVVGAGAPFADGGIIGGPPRAGYDGPGIYVSGPDATRLAELNQFGLKLLVMDAPVGAASALKMCYGGLTKGLIALGASLALAADRAGIAEALQTELAQSQPALVAWFQRMVPGMPAKAYRWVAARVTCSRVRPASTSVSPRISTARARRSRGSKASSPSCPEADRDKASSCANALLTMRALGGAHRNTPDSTVVRRGA
jgi:3-hydroxyisobutyrate dehydrogenase-like beta-hydroxyacid dehydrogenase